MPRYAELLPNQLNSLWAANAPAIVPWGALEWHGSHLPLGLDGIVADFFAERLAEQVGGVLLPQMWVPMTTLPHPHSIQFRTETFRGVLDDLLGGLFQSGARRVCLITGHYAQGHQVEMSEAALRAMEDYSGLLVLCATPLELLDDDRFLDHAGHYETSQLLAIRPELVHLELRPLEYGSPHNSAVLGEAPELGTAEEGEALLEAGLNSWCAWLEEASAESLNNHYKSVFDRYATYVRSYYRGSWEDAIEEWWSKKGEPE